MHCFAHQPSAKWTGSNQTMVIVGDDADEVNAVRVGAVAQTFAHLADVALRRHGIFLEVAFSNECPSLTFDTFGSPDADAAGEPRSLSCLQAIYFGPGLTAHTVHTLTIINRCEAAIEVEIGAVTVHPSTTYVAGDTGGWATLPPLSSPLPWKGPITPRSDACAVGAEKCVLPPVSLTLVDVEK